jgi:SAM-dependent methyltransferase
VRFARKLIDFSSTLLGSIKRKNKIILPSNLNLVSINLGCGLAVAKGWINVDGSLNALIAGMPKFFHTVAYRLTGANRYYSKNEYCRLLGDHHFIHHDLAYGVPFEDGVVDFIYSSHFLEHLFYKDAQHLINECHRVLKPNGTIRISVPDLEYAVKLYHSGKKHEMLQNYFFVEDDASNYARHKYMYDFGLLSESLSLAGFQNIRRCEYQEGLTPDLEKLDNRPEESLFVEATRVN